MKKGACWDCKKASEINRSARCRPCQRKYNNDARRERNQAFRDCGLIKVKGALGGTYWE